jgi:hypothetical protein
MRRYYLSQLIADEDDAGVTVPAVALHAQRFAAVAPVPAPPGAWSLCVVDDPNQARILADARNRALPDMPFDVQISAMRSATRQALAGAVAEAGLQVTWGPSDGYRDVVRSLGQQIGGSGFSEDRFFTAR